MIVGHSLGSVVDYNVLRNNPEFAVQKYITVGSPLGMASFRSKLETPLGMPSCVKDSWYNAYGDEGVVALLPLNSPFKIKPPIVDYKSIKNRTKNRHRIKGYLDDPNFAKEIYYFLRNWGSSNRKNK